MPGYARDPLGIDKQEIVEAPEFLSPVLVFDEGDVGCGGILEPTQKTESEDDCRQQQGDTGGLHGGPAASTGLPFATENRSMVLTPPFADVAA